MSSGYLNGDDVNRRELTVGEVYQADLKDTVSWSCTEAEKEEWKNVAERKRSGTIQRREETSVCSEQRQCSGKPVPSP